MKEIIGIFIILTMIVFFTSSFIDKDPPTREERERWECEAGVVQFPKEVNCTIFEPENCDKYIEDYCDKKIQKVNLE